MIFNFFTSDHPNAAAYFFHLINPFFLFGFFDPGKKFLVHRGQDSPYQIILLFFFPFLDWEEEEDQTKSYRLVAPSGIYKLTKKILTVNLGSAKLKVFRIRLAICCT